MAQGVVKWFNLPKRFGFIECDGTGAEVFVQCSKATGNQSLSVAVGDRVEFEVDDRLASALRAKNVRKLDLTPARE